MLRDFHHAGRSPVIGTEAMCATSHPRASLTAIEVLRAGGNAVDAAIAAAAVLAVVEPHMTGIGGDCFVLMHKPGHELIALSGAGRSPAAASLEKLRSIGVESIDEGSPHAVTVPCAIAAWTTLHADHGRMAFAELMAPAIGLAEGGFAVAPRVGRDWAQLGEKLERHAGARKHLLFDGKPPRTGDIIRFPALGESLKQIAAQGRKAFYEGALADDMIATLGAMGGLHTKEDFAAQRAEYVVPISQPYGGYDLYELPPSNHGIVALIILGILKRLGVTKAGAISAERYHLILEAARLAYAVRDAFVADPDAMDVSVEALLSDDYLDGLAGRINRDVRSENLGPPPRPTGSDTVYFCVADKEGCAVSFINSVYSSFGSGIVTEKSGIAFHNRGQGFNLDEGHANCIAPRKRPMHTLVPAIAMKDGRPGLVFGVMGAAFQPIGHVYVLTNIADFGMDIQDALDCPRIFFDEGRVEAEKSVPAGVVEELNAMGHDAVVREDPWGGGQGIQIDASRGILTGGSDPRKDGCALGY